MTTQGGDISSYYLLIQQISSIISIILLITTSLSRPENQEAILCWTLQGMTLPHLMILT